MAHITCELCGSTNLVKEDGVFVCKGCGAKYSVDEARKMMENTQPAVKTNSTKRIEEIKAKARAAAEAAKNAAQAPIIKAVKDFDPQLVASVADARIINNYACQGIQALLDDYKTIEHPSRDDQTRLVSQAKDCLVLLQTAALVDPTDHLANLLIYLNCDELTNAVRDTSWWDQNEKGEWKSHSLGISTNDLKIAGQKDSWTSLARDHQDYVEMAWLESNEDLVTQRRELSEKAAQVQSALSELKEEKKGLGFAANIPLISNLVNSDAKEVNERIKPVREELKVLQTQITAIDREKTKWVDEQLKELAKSYIRLDF